MKTVPLASLVTSSGRRAGANTDLPVYSVTKHSGFVPSLEYFKKQVFSRDVAGYKLVEPGEFAYATIHLDEGSVGVAPVRALISPMYTVFRCHDSLIDANYLIRYLKSPRAMSHYQQLGRGAVHRRKAISLDVLGALEVPLPSLDEQRRIAAILDKLDALRAKRRTVLAHLEALVQSSFEHRFAALKANREFGDVCQRMTVGVVVKPASHYVHSGVVALRTLNIKPGKLDLSDLVYFSESASSGQLAKSRLRAGDLVISRTGNTGVAAVVPASLDGANAIDIIVATPDPAEANSTYLVALLNSDYGRRLILGESRGQIQQHFNLGALRHALVPIPPLPIQKEFAAAVTQIHNQRASSEASLDLTDELFASIQARAFTGQL